MPNAVWPGPSASLHSVESGTRGKCNLAGHGVLPRSAVPYCTVWYGIVPVARQIQYGTVTVRAIT